MCFLEGSVQVKAPPNIIDVELASGLWPAGGHSRQQSQCSVGLLPLLPLPLRILQNRPRAHSVILDCLPNACCSAEWQCNPIPVLWKPFLGTSNSEHPVPEFAQEAPVLYPPGAERLGPFAVARTSVP